MKYPFFHETTIRVHYYDTDKMGVVWHGNYVRFFETARTEAMRAVALCYDDLEKSGIMMPIVELSVQYLKPALYDELLTVETRVEKAPGARMRFDYTVRNSTGEINATGHTTLAFIDSISRRPCRPPKSLRTGSPDDKTS